MVFEKTIRGFYEITRYCIFSVHGNLIVYVNKGDVWPTGRHDVGQNSISLKEHIWVIIHLCYFEYFCSTALFTLCRLESLSRTPLLLFFLWIIVSLSDNFRLRYSGQTFVVVITPDNAKTPNCTCPVIWQTLFSVLCYKQATIRRQNNSMQFMKTTFELR